MGTDSKPGAACRVSDPLRRRKLLLLDTLLPMKRKAVIAALEETKACSPTGEDHSHR